MAYSNTVGQTTISVQQLIDHGARRSGKFAEELTIEQVQSAKESLFYLLSNLINQGIQYFAIKKQVIGLKANQAQYVLPVGSNDVLNALYRRLNRPPGVVFASSGNAALAFDRNTETSCLQTLANGNIGINFGAAPVYAGSIGILPAVSGSFHTVLEWSKDNVTWSTLFDPGATSWVSGTWLWYDIDPGVNAPFYRMRETSGNTLNVSEFYVGTFSTEVTMSRLNRDDYTNLPNKNFTADQPFQFWFNRTIPQPTLTLWPVPSDPFVQVTVWYSAYIQDVGALSGELAIPDRWYLAIQCMLAHQMSQELPGVDMARVQYLEGQAEKYFQMAENEERDKSPIYFQPNISVYSS
jgi:hypothetical protein